MTAMHSTTQHPPFAVFQQALAQQFDAMGPTGLYRVAIGRDDTAIVLEGQHAPSLLWTTYLSSFPPGANPVYRTRTKHDCSCCRAFVRTMGGVVTIKENALVTLWDCPLDGAYGVVAQAMATLVRTTAARTGIADIFLSPVPTVGAAVSRQRLPSGLVTTWEHFVVQVPSQYHVPKAQLATALGTARTTHDVFRRALTEIPLDAINTVLDLIDRQMLYRGAEHRHAVHAFRNLKHMFEALASPQEHDLFAWAQMTGVGSHVTHIRNTAIGTLLVDCADGLPLDQAVRAYEGTVAPQQYQRPTALVTTTMIANAQAEIERLDLTAALERRYAVLEDITINNVLWADRSARQAMGVFATLATQVPVQAPKASRVQDVPIEAFLAELLPQATALEVYVENRHTGNFVSLIAPVDPEAPRLFQWDNGFSWTYQGDVADAIKERVKAAGGNVEADFRASLAWGNFDDLDLHLREPSGWEIFFANGKRPDHSPHGGQLDVDMNAGHGTTRTPVENIVYPRRAQMAEGDYALTVHNYAKRDDGDGGFDVEIAFDGQVFHFTYPQTVRHNERVRVARWHYTHREGLTMLESLPEAQASKTVWGLPTQTWRTVRVVMRSPNYWDAQTVGHQHWFFMLEGCQRDGPARGFFNEYLRTDLRPHRKVLELVGAKMRTTEAARQLAGVGFSSTVRTSLLCKVHGPESRTINLCF